MKFNQKISILNFPLNRTYILLKEDFRKKLFNRLISTAREWKSDGKSASKLASFISKKSSKYKYQKTSFQTVYDWMNGKSIVRKELQKKGYNRKISRYMPLWALIELINLLRNNKYLDNIDFQIESYRAESGGKIINPKLPILVTPEFSSLVFHLFGDGFGGEYGHFGGKSFYAQKNPIGRKNFLNKLKYVFGDLSTKGECSKTERVYIPSIIVHILRDYYKIPTFKSKLARIPEKIKKESKLHKLACLSAIILDDGTVRKENACMVLFSKNKPLLTDVKKLAESVGYKMCNPRLTNKKDIVYGMTFPAETVRKFAEDIQLLIKEHPLCSLGQKQRILDKHLQKIS